MYLAEMIDFFFTQVKEREKVLAKMKENDGTNNSDKDKERSQWERQQVCIM